MTLKLLRGFNKTPTKLGSTPLIKSSLLEFAVLFPPVGGCTPGEGGMFEYALLRSPLLPLVARRSDEPSEVRNADFSLGLLLGPTVEARWDAAT